MAAYIVCYDLMAPGQNYDRLTKTIESYYKTHWKMQQSVWIIQSTQTATQIRDHLNKCLDRNDKLFVGKLSAGAWSGYPDNITKWLKSVIT